MKRAAVTVLIIASMGAAFGCKKKSPPSPQPSAVASISPAASVTASAPAPSVFAPSASAVTALPPAPAPGAPGPMYIADLSSLWMADVDGKITEVKGVRTGRLFMGGDGRMYVANGDVYRLDGATAVKVAAANVYADVITHSAAITARVNGHLLYSSIQRPTVYEAAQLAPESARTEVATFDGKPGLIVAGANDELFVAGTAADESSMVTTYAGGKAAAIALPTPPEGSGVHDVIDLQAGPDGLLLLRKHDLVFVSMEGLKARTLLTEAIWDLEHIDVSGGDGRSVVLGGDGTIYAISPKLVVSTLRKFDRRMGTVAIDSADRVFVWEGNALMTIDAKGKTQTYPQGTIPLIDEEIRQCLIVGTGPASIQTTPPRTGTIHGEVFHGTAPAVGTTVEICQNAKRDFAASPCESAWSKRTAKTDAQGAFSIPDVPAGPYNVTFKNKSGWVVRSARGIDPVLSASENVDAKAIDLDAVK